MNVKKPNALAATLGLFCLGFASVQPLAAQEYWRDYFHLPSMNNFDEGPQMYGELSEGEAKGLDTYTVLRRDKEGRPIEAVSMLEGEANYYYKYYYNDRGDPVLLMMNAFLKDGETPMAKVVYSYREDGSPLSTAYYSYNFFSKRWKIKFLKEYSGGNYRLFDYREKQENKRVERELREVNRRLEELQELESRNFLKKMLGIR